MAGNVEDIAKIKELNQIDKIIFECKKSLEDSPLKQKIVQVREKKDAVKQKRDQVDKIFVTARNAYNEMSDKDSKIVEDIKRTQAEIDKNSGDYRKVQDASNNLASLKTQREAIDVKLIDLEENYNKIKQLKSQIDQAIEKFSMQEDELTQKFVAENASANQQLMQATKQRQNLQTSISPDVLKFYAHALERVGANCLGDIDESDTCTVCRNKLTASQISKARQEAPLSKCPHCGRLLVVEN